MSDQDQQSSSGGSNSDIKKVSEDESPRYSLDMDEKNQLSNVKVIWVIGVPGSGKGTQLKKISEKYNCTLIGGGDLMRNEISENTDLGKEIKTALEEGRKPSKGIVWDLTIKATKMALAEKNDYIFFDGAPRDSSQVGTFEEYIKPCDLILNLEIDKNTSMTRIQQRAKIEGRIDDQDMKRVENRLDEYQENIGSVLKETRDRNYKYAEIDADKSEDEVFEDICNEIEKLSLSDEGVEMQTILKEVNLINSKLDLMMNLINSMLESHTLKPPNTVKIANIQQNMDVENIDMRRELECPVCLILPRSAPIYQCPLGHILCSECVQQLVKCPICRTVFTNPRARSLIAEKWLETMDRSCRYEVLGCDFSSHQSSRLVNHESSCGFKPSISYTVDHLEDSSVEWEWEWEAPSCVLLLVLSFWGVKKLIIWGVKELIDISKT